MFADQHIWKRDTVREIDRMLATRIGIVGEQGFVRTLNAVAVSDDGIPACREWTGSWKTISLRLPQHLLNSIKIAANSPDAPYQSLIKVWEKMHEH